MKSKSLGSPLLQIVSGTAFTLCRLTMNHGSHFCQVNKNQNIQGEMRSCRARIRPAPGGGEDDDEERL